MAPTTAERLSAGKKASQSHEKIQKANELHKSGLSYRAIGNALDINEATAFNYVNDYPYKR